jgi:signal transduction histidine kinase
LRLNETFVAVLAHDLRTPLSSIAMAIEIFRGSHDVQAATVAERLHSSTARMSGLIEQLCDLSRVRLGAGFNLALRDVDLVAVVRRCIAELEPSAGPRFDVRAPSALALVGDEGRLAQVVSNILGNAIRHGHPERPIEVLVREGVSSATLEIRNGGVIPPEQRGELFLPFKSHAKRTGKREGLGLGLYIADQIVRAHAGSIDVVSGDGETTVRTTLPRGGPQQGAPALDTSPAR